MNLNKWLADIKHGMELAMFNSTCASPESSLTEADVVDCLRKLTPKRPVPWYRSSVMTPRCLAEVQQQASNTPMPPKVGEPDSGSGMKVYVKHRQIAPCWMFTDDWMAVRYLNDEITEMELLAQEHQQNCVRMNAGG